MVKIEDIGKELADVIIYADLIATHFKIDLGLYIATKFNEVSQRIGSVRKLEIYDEYEMEAILSGNRLSDVMDFLKEKELDEELNNWLHEHDQEKAN